MDGWVDGWVEVKAVLRIAYSNQQTKYKTTIQRVEVCFDARVGISIPDNLILESKKIEWVWYLGVLYSDKCYIKISGKIAKKQSHFIRDYP